MANPTGTLETIAEQLPGQTQQTFSPARYYRVRVTNRAAFPPAEEVEVLLTQFERRGPNGQPQRLFTGALPLQWVHQSLYARTRTIGRATVAEADLLVARQQSIALTPMVTPLSFPGSMQGETHVWVTVVARGPKGESRPLRLKIDWNGKWDRGDIEMAQHLQIAPD